MVKSQPAILETRIWPLGWEDPLEKGMATHSSFLAWRIAHVVKRWTQLSLWASQVAPVVKNHLPVQEIWDGGSIPESGRSPAGGHGNPLQYSCLKNPIDKGAWWAAAHRVPKSQTRLKRLSTRHAQLVDASVQPLSPSLYGLLIRIPVTGFKVHCNLIWSLHNLISANNLFPKMVTFWSSRWTWILGAHHTTNM